MSETPARPREALLVRTLVELADTLVDHFDAIELLTVLANRCVEILGVSAAGLILAAPDGRLQVVASSSEAMRVVELFELQAEEGPCLDCLRTGEPSVNHDLASATGRWPRFSPVALEAGFTSAHAMPMRLRGVVIGALNLFGADAYLSEPDVIAARALADVATIAILQHRAALEAHELNEQLSGALRSRVVIEQAKGVVAERAGLDMQQAFSLLRKRARDTNRRLADVARAVVDGTLELGAPNSRPRR